MMKKELAESFSLSFHPLFVAFYSIVFVFVLPIFEIQSLGPHFQMSILILAFTTTVVLPVFSLFMMQKQNIISSIRIEKREQRFIPYLLLFTYYAFTSFIIYRINNIPILIPLLFAIPAISAIALAFFNIFFKVSAHALSMASLNTLLIVLWEYYGLNLILPIIVTLVLSIIVVVSRYYLKAHSWKEIIIGYLLGMIITAFLLYIVLFQAII